MFIALGGNISSRLVDSLLTSELGLPTVFRSLTAGVNDICIGTTALFPYRVSEA